MGFTTPEQLEAYVQKRIAEANVQLDGMRKLTAWLDKTAPTPQHISLHNDTETRITMKVEKNSKGYNWEVSVSGAKTVEEALALIQRGNDELKAVYGDRP